MIGERVGPYAVVERLGGGGMGEVYLAEDTRLGRRVALKRPSAAFLSAPDARERLHREASAAGRLSHPNIASIYDVLDVDDYPYIVMEYVEGENLSAQLARGPLSVERSVGLGLQIADALVAAHSRGVIHRDLKPTNISVTTGGIAKILDFGIARAPSTGAQDSTSARRLETITVTGQAMATPGYSSPDQIVGAGADPRDDIYSLGVVLYELVTGRRPFEGADALERVLAAVTKTAPLAHQINPEVPPELSGIVARAMARDRADRYATADDLRTELQRVSKTLTAPAAVPTAPAIDRPAWRPSWLVIALVLLIGSGAVALGLWWRSIRPQAPGDVPVVAVLPFANNSVPEDGHFAAAMGDVLIANLGTFGGINVLSKSATAADNLARGNPRQISKALGATYLVDGSLQRSGTDLKVSISLVDGATGLVTWSNSYSAPEKELFSLQERIAEGVGRAGPLATSTAAQTRKPTAGTNDVDALTKYGLAAEALERPDIPGNLQRAVAFLRSAIERDPNFSLAYARLGEAYWAIYQANSEPKWASEAVAATTRALTLDQQQPEVWISLALIHQGTGRREEALAELDKALTLQPNNDEAHRLMGQVLQSLERSTEAEAHYREAVALRPNYSRHHSLLGAFYYSTGRTSDALAAFTRVTELQPDNARGFNNLGVAYYALGDNANALKAWERSVAIAPIPATLSNIGNIHFAEGRYEAAAIAFQQAVTASPNDGLLRGNLGDALSLMNRKNEARQAWLESVRLDRQALAVNPNDATTLARIALREAKLGNRSAAEADISRALSINASDSEVLYHAAVVRALNGNHEEALAFLERALKQGYSAAVARRDRDLDGVRQTARFRQLVGQ